MKSYKHYLPYILILLLAMATLVIIAVNKDSHTLKSEIINKHQSLRKEINNLQNQIKKEKIKTDSIYKPDLNYLGEQALNLESEINEYRIDNEAKLEELYVNQLHFWLAIIGLITSVLVLLGLKFHIGDKVTEFIANEVKKKNSTIKELLDNSDWEFQLMGQSNIIIVNPNKNNDNPYLNKLLGFFKNKGGLTEEIQADFNNTDVIIEQAKQKYQKGRLNILLLENGRGNDWDLNNPTAKTNAVKIAVELYSDYMLLYFGPREAGDFPNRSFNFYEYFIKGYSNLTNKDKEEKEKEYRDTVNAIIDKISFANTPSKLYPNLIDALKYLDIINETT